MAKKRNLGSKHTALLTELRACKYLGICGQEKERFGTNEIAIKEMGAEPEELESFYYTPTFESAKDRFDDNAGNKKDFRDLSTGFFRSEHPFDFPDAGSIITDNTIPDRLKEEEIAFSSKLYDSFKRLLQLEKMLDMGVP